VLLAGCGSSSRAPASSGIPRSLLQQARQIGAGPRFQPPVRGPVIGRCRRGLGTRSAVHVEVFAANRVVLVPAGIGSRPPRALADGQITDARCYADLVTLAPTGVVLVRAGLQMTVAQLFRSWGETLKHVAAFVDGRRWRGQPGAVPLARHSEIVLEVGPYVPPHKAFAFPPGS
jgi:hypothetical protein